jgi:hypothetical protein
MSTSRRYPSAVLSFVTGPIRTEVDNGRVILTHLQKYSHFGFMFTWPFCFHFWLFWKLQEGSEAKGWKEGTEQGIYFRTPGWRWDKELGMKPTGGRIPGTHWD